jgi:predicted PurR-regulated permease PerM
MRALVLLAAATFIAYGSFFALIGIPYGILLAVIAFLLEFIPLLGPLVAAVAIFLVAGLSGFPHMLWIFVFLGVFRVFQDYILSPYLLSKGAKLHPVMVIFGILAGGQIAGIPGTFLAIPIMAILRIVYRQLKKKSSDSTLNRAATGMA